MNLSLRKEQIFLKFSHIFWWTKVIGIKHCGVYFMKFIMQKQKQWTSVTLLAFLSMCQACWKVLVMFLEMPFYFKKELFVLVSNSGACKAQQASHIMWYRATKRHTLIQICPHPHQNSFHNKDFYSEFKDSWALTMYRYLVKKGCSTLTIQVSSWLRLVY